MNGCNKDCVTHKTENIYYVALYQKRKRLLTLDSEVSCWFCFLNNIDAFHGLASEMIHPGDLHF